MKVRLDQQSTIIILNRIHVEEKLFVSSDKAYDRAQEEVGGLVYYNVENGCLYTIADDVLYKNGYE